MKVWTQRVTCKVSDARRTLTLHGTRCVHTSMNLRKMKFISYIYTLILHRFCLLFVNFLFKLANKRRRKVIIRRVWLLNSTAVTMTWRQSNVTLANQLLHLSMTTLTRNIARTSVVHGMWTSSVQKVSSKEIVGECKYSAIYCGSTDVVSNVVPDWLK